VNFLADPEWHHLRAIVTHMGSAATDWVTLLFTTLGGGVVGSIVATYGSQTRERRQARAEAREAIKRAEKAAVHGTYEDFDAALEDLETRAMLAGLPRFVMNLYRKARTAQRYYHRCYEEAEKEIEENASKRNKADMWLAGSIGAARIAVQTTRLLVNATWHPWYGAPLRWYQARKLDLMLEGNGPFSAPANPESRSIARNCKRELIRRGKRIRRERH